jgi:molybdopterin-guanine dinucleotide biosynthesis protein A
LINHVIEAMSNEVNEIICVVGSTERKKLYESVLNSSVKIYDDKYKIGSPLIGLITGLSHCKNNYALVVACDMPFLKPSVIRYLHDRALNHDGSVIVKSNGWIEPFLSVYGVTPSIVEAERLFRAGDLRLRMVLRNLTNVVHVSMEEIDLLDPEHISFFDVDTEDKVALAEQIIAGR